ncbi:hypothetical protein VTN96DRAFT_6147 [Rasamsonia emersonii]
MNSALRQTAINGSKVIRRSSLLLQTAVQVAQPNNPPSATTTATLHHHQHHPLERAFHTSTPVRDTEHHEKDVGGLIDRNTLNPLRSEYSKSGTDDEVATHQVAFDPDNTAPEDEVDAAGHESRRRGNTSNPLDVSPGNQEVSKARDPMEGGAEHGVEKGPSAQGWTRKRRPVNTGGVQQS